MEYLRYLGALIYPEYCPYCSRMIEPLQIACAVCYNEVRRKHLAIPCGARGFRCVSSFVYGGKVRRMVLRIKYRECIQHLRQIIGIFADDINKAYGETAFDFITCVPMYGSDENKREYNQSKLLAKELSNHLGIPYLDALKKVKKTKKQHTLTYKERKTNLNGAFELIAKELIKDKNILIVDDIITSGNTLGECCKTLSKGKPKMICCATVASAQGKYPERTII